MKTQNLQEPSFFNAFGHTITSYYVPKCNDINILPDLQDNYVNLDTGSGKELYLTAMKYPSKLIYMEKVIK